MEVNVTGALLCCQAVIPDMVARGYGRIVTIGSVAGKEASPQIAAYAASKAAIISLTKTLARELATTGVTVNCVAPGAIRTRIFDDWPEEYVGKLLAKIPMNRFGLPEELAELVAFVASRRASFQPVPCLICRAGAPTTDLFICRELRQKCFVMAFPRRVLLTVL